MLNYPNFITLNWKYWTPSPHYKFIALSSNHHLIIYLFSTTYYFILNKIFFTRNFFNNLSLSINFSLHSHLSLVKITMLLMFMRVTTLKIIFNGKGYRSYISFRNTIAFSFGYSHLFYLYTLNTQIHQLTKTKLLFFGLNFFLVHKTAINFYQIKPLNIFTLKGVRFKKQIFRKKIGKLSLYV
uniref:50S ribosomal protein L6 n=1 Tax=Euplotes vanleeuwenhoeki TaxID=2794224 RepID=A0A7T1C520_9SPIT|nr:50S ribosomal protein L6 [Euplotes vanleeuwenhoeki]QPM99268.1 50S ribosomal protein L6 [Euplotes vanleeuwenhoeki]